LAIFFACFTQNKNDEKEASEHMDIDPIDFTNDGEQEVCFHFLLINN